MKNPYRDIVLDPEVDDGITLPLQIEAYDEGYYAAELAGRAKATEDALTGLKNLGLDKCAACAAIFVQKASGAHHRTTEYRESPCSRCGITIEAGLNVYDIGFETFHVGCRASVKEPPNFKAFAGVCKEKIFALNKDPGAATCDDVIELWQALHDLAEALGNQ